ncbi:MAG: DUF4922 domain-containing protein [Bacteroidales bacterium]
MKKRVKQFFEEQLQEWERAAHCYKKLESVVTKSVTLNNFNFQVQFNPGRIISSSAVVANIPTSPQKCFLCSANRPLEQRGIAFSYNSERYQILINPFPIFQYHLTIALEEHSPQTIRGRVGAMLSLSNELEDFALFFNGAKGGASAPGHFHFQAVPYRELPLIGQLPNLERKTLFGTDKSRVVEVESYFKGLYTIATSSKNEGERLINQLLEAISATAPLGEEGVNILAWYQEGEYNITLFVRGAHRSSHFFREAQERVLISMGSIDLAGVVITPLEIDFNRAGSALIGEIVSEIELGEELSSQLTKEIIEKLNGRAKD